MKKKHLLLTTGLAIITLALGACQTALPPEQLSRSDEIAAAIRRAENASGITQSLQTLEGRYKRNPESEIYATQYAYALRHADQIKEAGIVLKPFAIENGSSAATKTEYANILLAQGNPEGAEKMAQKAVIADDGYDRAYHTLGIALDTQGMHPEAERAFRKGLELWKGDPTNIMNNLALNLTSQDFLDEALEILQKAQALSPERTEIERNLRIVTALKQSQLTPVPTPRAKPALPKN